MLQQVIFVGVLCLLVAPSVATLTRLHVETVGARRQGIFSNSETTIPAEQTILGIGNIAFETGASGYIISDHEDIVCGYNLQDDCQADFPELSEVVLTATAHSGSRFAGWVVPEQSQIIGETCLTSQNFPNPLSLPGKAIRYPPNPAANLKSKPLYTNSCRVRLVGLIVKVRALFIVDETRVVEQTDGSPPLPITVASVTYPAGVLSSVPATFPKEGYTNTNTRYTGMPEIDYGKSRDGSFDISFLGTQLNDEVLVFLKQVQWICNDDVDRIRFPLADLAVQNRPVVAQNTWKGLSATPALPQYGVCQVNVTVLTNSTNAKIPRDMTFTHMIRVLGGGKSTSETSHILTSNYQLDSAWTQFSSFITEIPAGIRINTTNGIERRRYKQKDAPPAGNYAMDVTIQVKGTTVDNDAVVCTAGFHKFGSTTLILPPVINLFTSDVSTLGDATGRNDRDWADVWLPAGSVAIRHLKRVIQLGNNETPPDVVVICKSLGTISKRNIDSNLDAQARSISVGPITTVFRRLDTPWVLDSVVMNYRFGNMVTRVPS
jgi:hypothetical protein